MTPSVLTIPGEAINPHVVHGLFGRFAVDAMNMLDGNALKCQLH